MAPGGFKYEPRAMADAPRQFGKSSERLRPAPGFSASDPQFIAAQLQHRVAYAVREALLRGPNLEAFVTGLRPRPPGMTYDRLVRIHRGETLMQLADLVNWAQRFATVRAILADEDSWIPSEATVPVNAGGDGSTFSSPAVERSTPTS